MKDIKIYFFLFPINLFLRNNLNTAYALSRRHYSKQFLLEMFPFNHPSCVFGTRCSTKLMSSAEWWNIDISHSSASHRFLFEFFNMMERTMNNSLGLIILSWSRFKVQHVSVSHMMPQNSLFLDVVLKFQWQQSPAKADKAGSGKGLHRSVARKLYTKPDMSRACKMLFTSLNLKPSPNQVWLDKKTSDKSSIFSMYFQVFVLTSLDKSVYHKYPHPGAHCKISLVHIPAPPVH